jgi:hypothetical protein
MLLDKTLSSVLVVLSLMSGYACGAPGRAIASEDGDHEPQWKQVLQERLRQQVHCKFEDTSFKDAKAYLEAKGRVVINVDKLAQEANGSLNDTMIQLASPEEGMSLESALNYLTKAVGLAWTLRDETIVITTQDGLRERACLRQYDVRDLIGEIKDYGAPATPNGGSAAAGGGAINLDEAEQDEEKKVTGETLVDFIKEYVDKPVWDSPENSIQFKNGRLFVTAPPETHKRIGQVLDGFRAQRILLVRIQARALSVELATWREIQVKEGERAGAGLNDAQTKLLEEALMSGGAVVVEQCQTLCFNTQRVYVDSRGMQGGMLVDVRPVVFPDLRHASLDLKCLVGGADFRTSVVVSDGGMAVFTASSSLAGPKDKRILVLTVNARIIDAGK